MLTMELERFIAVLGLAYELPYVPDDSARREQDLLHITMVDNAFSFVTGMMLKSGESLDISYHSVTYIWQQNLRVPKRVVLQNLPPRVWTSIKSLRLQVLLFLARLLSLLQPRVRHLFVLQKQVWFCKWYLFLKNLPFFFTVPFYDGRRRQLQVPDELRKIPDVLPHYVGNVPEYSLVLMAYTVSTYSAPSGARKDQVTANLNIHFGVVLHEPLVDSASASDNEGEDEAKE